MGGLLVTALSAPVSAAGTIQISGSGYYDDAAGTECGVPPAGFDSYAGLVLSGDLEGCLYTDVLGSKFHEAPSGIYIETGRELIVASLNGAPVATFATPWAATACSPPRWTPARNPGTPVASQKAAACLLMCAISFMTSILEP